MRLRWFDSAPRWLGGKFAFALPTTDSRTPPRVASRPSLLEMNERNRGFWAGSRDNRPALPSADPTHARLLRELNERNAKRSN